MAEVLETQEQFPAEAGIQQVLDTSNAPLLGPGFRQGDKMIFNQL